MERILVSLFVAAVLGNENPQQQQMMQQQQIMQQQPQQQGRSLPLIPGSYPYYYPSYYYLPGANQQTYPFYPHYYYLPSSSVQVTSEIKPQLEKSGEPAAQQININNQENQASFSKTELKQAPWFYSHRQYNYQGPFKYSYVSPYYTYSYPSSYPITYV